MVSPRANRVARCLRTVFLLVTAALAAVACGGTAALSNRPIKWTDPDTRPVPRPVAIEENQVWDIIDLTFFYQMEKLLDVGWTARRVGNLLDIAPEREADNVNALDEVPNSSWFTNRHHLQPMDRAALERGPGIVYPDTTGPWEIVAGKFEGGTAGFTIKDAAGRRFLLKFDSEGNNEMGSAAEVIATKILHAAGYNVPANTVVYFHPSRLIIGPKATAPDGQGGRRPMTRADLQGILDNIIPQPDGRLRCVASAFLEGVPVGIFEYHGVRRDDPNDRVRHQHRRELRGLRVIGSWMNDADRRAANTLNMWVPAGDGLGYLKHYLIDMGSTFGSNNLVPHPPKYGNEYVWDPRTIARSLVSFGLYRKPWEDPLPMPYPELGYFENRTFSAKDWVPTYPNPAFQRCTARDGYWGAKIVMSFSDADIAAIVETGRYTNPAAAAELTRLLIERRDTIGRYWFGRVNPLDRFWIDADGLRFQDLAVAGGLVPPLVSDYRCTIVDRLGRPIGQPLGVRPGEPIPVPAGLPAGRYYGFELRTRRPHGRDWSPCTRVNVYVHGPGRYQIVRVDRET